MIGWLAIHARAAGGTVRRLVRAPLATLLNVIVLAVALALPAGLYLALVNVQQAVRTASPEPQLTVFMTVEAKRAEVAEVENLLKRHSQVAAVRHIPRDKALEELKRASGMAGIAEGLQGNPLPDAFVVSARDPAPDALARLRVELAAYPRVALVQLDTEWARRLDAVLRLARIALLVLATVLALALVAVTFNTIRLQILTQREEIEVASLIGATAAFIRRPFLYYGAALGLLGGAAACGVVWIAMAVLNSALLDLAYLYGAQWQLRYLAPADVASVLAFAAGLGWLGAWLSVARHLAAMR